MAKYYFKDDDADCYTLDQHLDMMAAEQIETLTVFAAKREVGTGMFFCKHFNEVGEVGQSCGKKCRAYQPRNGKSGNCKHRGYTYEQTTETRILTIEFC